MYKKEPKTVHRSAGRPPNAEDERRAIAYSLYLTPDENEQFKRYLRQIGMPASTFLRSILIQNKIIKTAQD